MSSLCKHPERPARARGMCASCYNSFLINRDPVKKAEIIAKKKIRWAVRYAARNSEAHAKIQKNRHLLHRYGINLDEYERMHVVQQNRCAICSQEGGKTRATRLYVDHNHTTGVARQLLCPGCNQAIGIVEQGLPRLSSLAAYLLVHEPKSEAWNVLAQLDTTKRGQE